MKWLRACCIVLFALTLVRSVAQAAPLRLADNAGLLDAGEESALLARLDALSEQYNVDIVIATTNNSRGMSLQYYAADLVDYNGFRTDNAILVIAMDIREYTLVTTGQSIYAFTDHTIEKIYDALQSPMSRGDYFLACDTFVTLCDKVLSQAQTGAPYDVGRPLVTSTFSYRFVVGLGVSALPAFLIGWLIARGRKNAMRTARPQRSAHNYVRDMRLTRERDIYLYATSTRRRIETQSSGGRGGGSSTFRGSSGRSHGGGGGRKF